jgi:excisionase family DNA binding protein
MPEEDWLTINEAAERLGTNRVKIWRLIKAGRLEARENPLDRREKLISSVAIEELLRLGRKSGQRG